MPTPITPSELAQIASRLLAPDERAHLSRDQRFALAVSRAYALLQCAEAFLEKQGRDSAGAGSEQSQPHSCRVAG